MRTAVLIADCAILHTIIVPQIQIISIVFYEFGKFFNVLTLYTSFLTSSSVLKTEGAKRTVPPFVPRVA